MVKTSTSKTAINIQKTCIPPGKALLLGEEGTGRVKTASAGTQKSKYIKFQSWKFKNSLLRLGKVDRIVPDIIKNGLKIDFMESPNIICSPKILHSELEKCIINVEIEKLLQKGVIIKCGREENNFASTVFTRDKKDGSFRTILSLKCLNKFVKYTHFKMESLKDVFKIIKEGVWMASVDLKDAFFTVPVHKSHQNYFKFEWFQGFYKFIGMPNGYTEARRIFTKILRPVFGYLRQEGYLLVIFVGDSYLQGNTESECLENIEVTVNLPIKLGFKIHEQNSILKPTQELEFLGFVINSKNMTFP